MKKKKYVMVFCFMTAIVGTFLGFSYFEKQELESDLTLANVEALAGGDDVTIVCSKGNDGRCFRKGTSLKMCKEYTYYACEYTGYTKDYCKNPTCK